MATPEELANAAKLAENQEALGRELARYNEGLAEAARLQINLNKATAEKLKLDVEAKEAKKQANDALVEQARIESEIKDIKQAMASADAGSLDDYQAMLDEEKKRLAVQVAIADAKSDELDLIKKKRKLIDDNTAAEKKYGKQVEENLKNADRQANQAEGIIKKFAGNLPVVGGSLSKLFDQKQNMATLGKGLTKLGGVTGGKFGKAIGFAGGSVSKFASGLGMASSGVFTLFMAVGRLALQFDNLSKEIGRTTGFGDKFNNTLLQGYKTTMMSGVSVQEYGKAITGLANNFSGFNPNAEKTNMTLANTASRLQKLGVGAESAAKLMDHFHRAMGVSQSAAADMTAQLVMMGREVGITTSKMASDFQASAGILARYGKDSIKVFKQLAAQTKATGLAMGTLLGMSAKFDQFDTAADSAGKLNAVLGTQLSTLELMSANESERIDMIKQQVQASVGNFDSLDKFTKMYIAQAMGVKDVAEAQRLMNMSMAERNALASKQKEQADIQAELAEATAKLVPMMDKLKIMGMKLFMVFEPLIGAFELVFAGIDKLYVGMSSLFDAAGGMDTVMTILKVVGITIGAITLPISGTAAAIVSLTAAIGGLWNILHKPGSLSMAGGLMDKTIGESVGKFGAEAAAAQKDISGLSSEMEGMYDAAHKGGDGAIDIQAMASLDTTAIAAGFDKIKSAVMELSSVKIDGFLAMSTSGDSSSFVMGSDGLIKSISEGKLIVDVKMPEMKLPEVLVKVFIGDTELTTLIDQRIEVMGGEIG